jgi:hypothetical protein
MGLIQARCRICKGHNVFEVGDQLLTIDNSRVTKNCESCNETIFLDIGLGSKPRKKPYRDKVWLKKEYEMRGRTLSEIAQETGVSAMTISQWVNRHNIESRDRGRRPPE